MTVRILHFADAHIDISNGGRQDPTTTLPVRAMDFLRSLDEIVAAAIDERVDLVIFSGDAYKDRLPTPTFQREWGQRIVRLSQAGIPTVLVPGNHDISPAMARAHTLDQFKTLNVPNIHVVDRPALLKPATLGVPIQVIGLPWISKSGLMATLGSKGEDLDLVLEQMESRLSDLLEKLFSKLDPAVPAVLASHAAVQGARLGAERSLSLGSEMSLSLGTVTDSRLDYTALGHIHLAQDLNEGAHPPVVYPGSIERVNFGEAKDKKYFVIAHVEKGRTEVEWRELHTRPFIDRSVTIKPDTADPVKAMTRALGKKGRIKDAVVRLAVTYPKDMEAQIDDEAVREYAKEALEFHFLPRPQAKQRIRLPETSVEKMSPGQLLDVYLKTVHADNLGTLLLLGESIFAEAKGIIGAEAGSFAD